MDRIDNRDPLSDATRVGRTGHVKAIETTTAPRRADGSPDCEGNPYRLFLLQRPIFPRSSLFAWTPASKHRGFQASDHQTGDDEVYSRRGFRRIRAAMVGFDGCSPGWRWRGLCRAAAPVRAVGQKCCAPP